MADEASRADKSLSPWPLVVCIAVVALSGAGLVPTIPHLFAAGDPQLWGLAAGLAIMVLGFSFLGRRLRPRFSSPEK